MIPPPVITSRIRPVGFREWSMIFFNCSPLYPIFFPRKYMEKRTAIISATNGVPRNCRAGRTGSIPGIYSEIVLHRISTSGTRMIHNTVENWGRLASSSSRTSCILEGSPVLILLPINFDHKIPAKSSDRIPTGTPTAIIIPSSTFSIFATSTEPAEGGINANPVARPARRGIT